MCASPSACGTSKTCSSSAVSTAKLGIVTGLDLAQACRQQYSRPTRIALWLLCEVAIAACDLAEVIGTAIALQLLFGIPLVMGICITAADVLLILMLHQRGFRQLEAFVVALLIVAKGFVPTREIAFNPAMLYIAIGILGVICPLLSGPKSMSFWMTKELGYGQEA